jgi:hypothetical protein
MQLLIQIKWASACQGSDPRICLRAKMSVEYAYPNASRASIQPASSRREKDVSTASPSSEPLVSDDDGSEAARESIAPWEEGEE